MKKKSICSVMRIFGICLLFGFTLSSHAFWGQSQFKKIQDRVARGILLFTVKHRFPMLYPLAYFLCRASYTCGSLPINAIDDNSGFGLLHAASFFGNRGAVDALIKSGAAVDIKCNLGRTPLSYAARQGYVGVAKSLIAAHASVNAFDRDSTTPLHLAAKYQRNQVIQALLNARANPNVVDRFAHYTPLHIATLNKNVQAVQLLLKAGANPAARGMFGTIPLDLAQQDHNLIDLLGKKPT